MGKKGKKGKGSGGGKKKGSKKKKSGEPQMTWKEALLAYQINIKEKSLEDIRYEVRALAEKNQRHKERNERLKVEQGQHIKNMLKQAEEADKRLAEETVVEKEQVIATMMTNWEVDKEEQKNIVALKESIARLESQLLGEERQVQYWSEYQAAGQHDHQKQIKLLEHELDDMQSSFDDISGHLEKTLNHAKGEIEKDTDDTLEKQKYFATEKAMAKMDKYSRQEVLDNDWLQREVDMHRKQVEILLQSVEEVERDNLEMMSELFECHVDDLKISRDFFLTQFSDNENLDHTGLLEMDLAKLSIAAKPDEEVLERPKSSMQLMIEDKVFSLPTPEEVASDQGDSDFEGDLDDNQGDDPFDNYFKFDDEDFGEYLHLGPLELKLLNVTGKKMQVYRHATPSVEEKESQDCRPDKWPVTGSMLQDTVRKPSPRNPRK